MRREWLVPYIFFRIRIQRLFTEVRTPAAGEDGRLAVATPFQIQTRDPDMWRFQRVDRHAVMDCELCLLWYIDDPG